MSGVPVVQETKMKLDEERSMKVLLADKAEQSVLDAFNELGYEAVYQPDLSTEDLADALAEHTPTAMIVRSTKVPAAVLEGAPDSLKLIVRAGAGYDNIDCDAASAKGIGVANCPGKNAIAVAELAWGLIIAADRVIPNQTADLKNGAWAKKSYAKHGLGLYGRTLGVLGTGHIAREVIKRAHGFGMPVIAWSHAPDDAKATAYGFTFVDSPLDIAKQADVVSVHVAQVPETKGMIDDAFIGAMKPGSTLINTARGGIVQTAAVKKALEAGSIRFGTDVYENQPTPKDAACGDDIQSLASLPGFVGSHHCGASTNQAQEATGAEAVRVVRVFSESGAVENCVNGVLTA